MMKKTTDVAVGMQAGTGGIQMETLKIEWRHFDVEGETCDRCYDTGENLNASFF